MSSADTGLSHNHNRVPYDSDDQDGNRSLFFVHYFEIHLFLAYRQQLRERSQPAHIVCHLTPHLFNLNFSKFSVIPGIVSLGNVPVISRFTLLKQLEYI